MMFKTIMMFKTNLLLGTVLALTVTACGGGGGGTPNPNPNPNPNPGGGNVVRDRLVACPLVYQSSDPAASACLAGTYSGKTLDSKDCSLVVAASGNYQFSSPALSYSYTANTKSIRIFSHQNVSGSHVVIWKVGDPVQLTDSYDLDFQYAQALSNKLEIQATKRPAAGGSVSSSCTLALN